MDEPPVRRVREQPKLVKSREWWDRFRQHRDEALEHRRLSERRKPPITAVLPVPRTVLLGGGEYVVNELRLRDLSELQQYVADAAPHPLRDLPPPEEDPDPGTRRARLIAAYAAARDWPPRLGSPDASALLAAGPGRLYFLHVCLREHNPGMDLAKLAALLPLVTPREMRLLRRVVWAVSPQAEILAELDPEADEIKLTDWADAANAVHEHRGVQYRDMGELYLSQWRNINSAGKHRGPQIAPRPGESPGDARLRVFSPEISPQGGAG